MFEVNLHSEVDFEEVEFEEHSFELEERVAEELAALISESSSEREDRDSESPGHLYELIPSNSSKSNLLHLFLSAVSC